MNEMNLGRPFPPHSINFSALPLLVASQKCRSYTLTLFFGDNPEFEDFLAQDLEGFLAQLASSHESSPDLLLPLLVLMGDEDYASMMTELATDDGDPQTQPASAEFVERLETVRIEESGLECSICLDQLSIGSEGRRLPCSHLYHGNCIEEWRKESKTCPLCRAS